MSDRFVRFMKFANGFAASLQRMPKPGVTEPSLGDLYRLPDGRARSERTPEEREAIMRSVRARVAKATRRDDLT